MHTINIPRHIEEQAFARRDHRHPFGDISVKNTALIVVDMQNGFMAPGQPSEIPTARDIVSNINVIASALRRSGGLVVFIQHTVDAEALSGWSNYFQRILSYERTHHLRATFQPGSVGHDLWPGLEVDNCDLKVLKRRFSAFTPGTSDLHSVLKSRDIDTLIITGTATHMCCESTARDAMMMNYKVIFALDATATHTDEQHNSSLGSLMFLCDVMLTGEVVERVSHAHS